MKLVVEALVASTRPAWRLPEAVRFVEETLVEKNVAIVPDGARSSVVEAKPRTSKRLVAAVKARVEVPES